MSEFIEVIEWHEENDAGIVHRYPETGSAEVKLGAQLVVRTGQAAIFFKDGKGLDVFGPGRHTLSTMNLPILTKLLSLPFGFKSPFRVEVYFVNQKVFTNMRWGTKDPVAFKDSGFGLIRLRAFGSFTMQVNQPLLFVNTVVGTGGTFATGQVEDYLREIIVSRLNDFLGEKVETLSDLPKHYDEMGVAIKSRLAQDFNKYGMELVDFFINRITPPEEVQKMIDDRAGMAAVGDLDQYLKFKAAKAMGDAAAGNGSTGAAASTIGAGIGAGLGMAIPGMIFKVLEKEGSGGAAGKTGNPGVVNCTECHGEVSLD
ncbi:MAG TPA: SPFH domain-containing protein, partial [Nitrospiria bacterium]|nr:SPFH domain-containing protein [Nitrospiria bacterium]